ncbi:MAG: diguanylate cyclase [Clostridia bacterium]|nr:diguanylate cyclase [Clostridia bacterium]
MNVTSLEMTQATIETFCGLVCLMFIIIIAMNGYERKSWRIVKWMFFSMAAIFLIEAATYICNGNTDGLSIFVAVIGNYALFALYIALLGLFVHFLYYLLLEKDVVSTKRYIYIVDVCVLIDSFILVVNMFNGWMFSFDEANIYHRNSAWYIYTAFTLVCIIACSAMCIKYRKAISKTMFIVLLFYSYVPVIAIIVQAFIFGISITNIGIFLALIIMLFTYLKEWSRTNERRGRERKSVEIIILFIIMTISMSASTISSIISIQRISADNSESNSLIIAHMVNSGIENEFIKPIMVSETMSQDLSLQEYMRRSYEDSPESVEKEVSSYLNSIRTGFGYQMVFAVCDASKAYYSYDGISKFVDIDNDEHDIWYKLFLEEKKHYDLDVDTDEANNWELSVFVNTEITDKEGKFLGVCGTGIEMTYLQDLLKQYENDYDIKIDLINSEGLIQVDSDAQRIERDYLDNSYLAKVGSGEFLYEGGSKSSRMTRYLESLDWYLVIEDNNPNKINTVSVAITSIVIFSVGLVMMGIVFSIIVIRERKASKEILEKRKVSITDDMTGLLNHRAYEEDCMKIIENNSLSEITVIMMDVNGLKTVNDSYGHMAGDELIIGAAKCIQTSMGEYGKVYRVGGDEFVALLECNESQLQDMVQTFEHITDNWKGTYQCELSMSKGIVVCKEHPELSLEEVKELADKLMYEDKDEFYARTGKKRRTL